MWQCSNLDLGSGRTLHFAQAGEGRDLVVVHGALATAHDWLNGPARRIVETLARTRRVTIVDRPGHGLSRRPRFDGTPRDQALQIAAGLAHLGIESADVLSHSFGGMVSLALAEQRPRLVRSLVLVAPIAFPEFRPIEHGIFGPRALPVVGPFLSAAGQATAVDRAFLAVVHRLMFAPGRVPEDWRETYPYEEILAAMTAEGEDVASIFPLSPAGTLDIAGIDAPTRILQGTSDLVVDRNRQSRPLEAVLRNADLIEVEGAGHMLHHSHWQLVMDSVRAMEREPQPA